jgi:hypothetical protein
MGNPKKQTFASEARMTKRGRERSIRLMTKMNSHIALRQAGIGQNQSFG